MVARHLGQQIVTSEHLLIGRKIILGETKEKTPQLLVKSYPKYRSEDASEIEEDDEEDEEDEENEEL